eukprot:GHVT01090554.1.p1 GENE.GHVT01090554.1~~GHVT01090554.1.p1  ORF type:complete len:113 (+),score=0.74 GHVT01090554.1:1152-1490(+)
MSRIHGSGEFKRSHLFMPIGFKPPSWKKEKEGMTIAEAWESWATEGRNMVARLVLHTSHGGRPRYSYAGARLGRADVIQLVKVPGAYLLPYANNKVFRSRYTIFSFVNVTQS